MQIQTHLDAQVEQQIVYLQQTTGQNMNAVLCTQHGGLKHFAAFIGKSRSGRSDIAGHYKEQLTQHWTEKYQRHKPDSRQGIA